MHESLESPNSIKMRKSRAYRALRLSPEFADDPRIDAFCRELLDELELLNSPQTTLFDDCD